MLTRRSFLKRSALATGSLAATRFFAAPNLLAAAAGTKLNCVQIGCGVRSMTHVEWVVTQSKDNLVAIVDPDEKRQDTVRRYVKGKGLDPAKIQAFTDYRVMFDKIGKQIDAVFIATPNHHHAPPAFLAMNLNKAVFCEKPLCHDIAQARKLREMARQSKAPTQMGNQGHCGTGYRLLCEYVWAGVIGDITETHSWTDRANGGAGPRPPSIPVPAGLHWEEWIGPAPFRPYHKGLHRHDWHGWYDFGNGSLGNMGCHVLDGVFWSLKLEHPTSVELEEVLGGSKERTPLGARIRWDFPARGAMPAVKTYWYEGFKKNVPLDVIGERQGAGGKDQNFPPLIADLRKRYPDEEFGSNGTLYVGTKGILYTGTYGEKMRVVPFEKMQQTQVPPRVLPRPQDVVTDFLTACREGKKETAASFDYSSRLTEFTLLGNLAQHAGVGKKLEWDGPNMKVTNLPEIYQWISLPVRPGWPK